MQPVSSESVAGGTDSARKTRRKTANTSGASSCSVMSCWPTACGSVRFYWSRNLRQVTTECGQCHGQAMGLDDQRVVMVFDHRYPRPVSSARAAVSDDEGLGWRVSPGVFRWPAVKCLLSRNPATATMSVGMGRPGRRPFTSFAGYWPTERPVHP